jgi:hypothetical protein
VLEYEDVLLRHTAATKLGQTGVDAVLNYFCKVAHLQLIFYLWRPLLFGPKDDLLLELAVAAGCPAIVTYNVRDFVGAEGFGLSVLAPAPFLSGLGVLE